MARSDMVRVLRDGGQWTATNTASLRTVMYQDILERFNHGLPVNLPYIAL